MSGDTLDFLQGTKETLTGTLHDPAATTGHVLTVQADKSIVAAPGGSSPPKYANYSGNPVTVTDGAVASLSLDTLTTGDDLLDLTAPFDPVFKEAGTYSFFLRVFAPVSLSPGGNALVSADIGIYGGNGTTANANSFHPEKTTSVAGVTVVDAGSLFTCAVWNFDGVMARDFYVSSCDIIKLPI